MTEATASANPDAAVALTREEFNVVVNRASDMFDLLFAGERISLQVPEAVDWELRHSGMFRGEEYVGVNVFTTFLKDVIRSAACGGREKIISGERA